MAFFLGCNYLSLTYFSVSILQWLKCNALLQLFPSNRKNTLGISHTLFKDPKGKEITFQLPLFLYPIRNLIWFFLMYHFPKAFWKKSTHGIAKVLVKAKRKPFPSKVDNLRSCISGCISLLRTTSQIQGHTSYIAE